MDPEHDPTDRPSGATTVLVVEDDLPVREMATHILEAAGWTVLSARSAEEALALFDGHPDVGLLFSDVVLPGRSGLELAAELVARRPGVRVLITTGQRTRDVHEAIEGAGHPFLAKPYTAPALREAAAAAVDPGHDVRGPA
jgi:CheY-like chemotaxis protein